MDRHFVNFPQAGLVDEEANLLGELKTEVTEYKIFCLLAPKTHKSRPVILVFAHRSSVNSYVTTKGGKRARRFTLASALRYLATSRNSRNNGRGDW